MNGAADMHVGSAYDGHDIAVAVFGGHCGCWPVDKVQHSRRRASQRREVKDEQEQRTTSHERTRKGDERCTCMHGKYCNL